MLIRDLIKIEKTCFYRDSNVACQSVFPPTKFSPAHPYELFDCTSVRFSDHGGLWSSCKGRPHGD